MTVWNIRVREHGYGRRPNGMVGVYLRELRSNRYSLHRIDTSPNLVTPSGLFSYQTAFSVFTLCFGCWKNAEHDDLILSQKLSDWQMHHHLLLFSPPGWFFVASSWVITAYSRPLASRVNLKLSRRRSRWPSLPRLH